MAKTRKRVKSAPPVMSKEEERTRADERRIRRELASVRRVGQLSKQLERAAAAVEVRTFQLGRDLVMARGMSVVSRDAFDHVQRQNTELRDKVAWFEEEVDRVRRHAAAGLPVDVVDAAAR